MKYWITKILNFGTAIYDGWAKHNLKENYHTLIELANLEGNEKVLDVGCGPGNLDLIIAGVLDKGSVSGIDLAPKMIETAKKKVQGYRMDYRVGDSTRLPYENNRFDAVFTCLIYHHLNYQEKNQTLKEIYRVLKPKGRYISLEFREFPSDVFHQTFLRLSVGDSGLMHGLHPTQLIKQNGFYPGEEIKGPCFGKHHRTSYRVLMKK